MNEKQLFPGYEPKKTPDTIEDYLPTSSAVFKVLSNIGTVELNKIDLLIKLFKEYEERAKLNPGGFKKGNVAIGADLDQYYPSDEEIILSEIGKIIKSLIEYSSFEEVNEIKLKMKIKTQKLTYNEVFIRHVDVMGSGRFFYAEKREFETMIKI
jgi:hypothetical protein